MTREPKERGRTRAVAAFALVVVLAVAAFALATCRGGVEDASDGDTTQTVEAPLDAAESAVAEDPAAKTSAAAPSGTASGGSSSSAPSGSGSSTGASGSSSTAGASSSTSHEHSWTAVTERRWVVDQAARDEDIYRDSIVCSCGLSWASTSAYSSHCKELLLSGGSGCSYSVKSTYVRTDHHDEVGHYETVTTGYRCSCGAAK